MQQTFTADTLRSGWVTIDNVPIHYLEKGQGDPILFLHGVPASAWLWRKVIPHLSDLGRCIAPDLAGFGQSGQPDITYTLADQLRLLKGFIDTLKLNRIIFVLHGWGGIPGLAAAMTHENRCKGLVFYETWLHPVTGEHLSLPWQALISTWRETGHMQEATQYGLRFIDHALRQMALHPFSENAMAHYCAPWSHSGSGRPLAHFIAEAPSGDGKSAADIMLEAASQQLVCSAVPKLLLYSVPGFLMTMTSIEWAKKHLSRLEVIEVGEELHFAQESQPALMGDAISAWLQAIEQSSHEKGHA